MPADFSRRHFFQFAAGAAVVAGPLGRALGPIAFAQQLPTPGGLPESVVPVTKRSAVALVKGENRRKNITEALMRIDDQIRPVLKLKKSVVIKPNNVATNMQLAATHADTLNGSKHANMKELRADTADQVLRIAFAFDPDRVGILLVAGDKGGVSQKRFYKQLIEKADKLFDAHLAKLKAMRKRKEK
jgi:hypothetical protein